MRIASLAMYVAPEPVAEATYALWHFLRDYLRGAGMQDVPAELDQAIPYQDVWSNPNLLLSQTCGYPYAKRLRGKVRLVATPRYGHPGCNGAFARSFVLVHASSGITRLDGLRGRVAAINSRDSNSGYNLFRAALAPVADGRRMFSSVLETGSHAASIEAVVERRADCAAVDCITYGTIARFSPERLNGTTVLAETPEGPGLPLITSASAGDREIDMLRAALDAALVDPRLTIDLDRMGLVGFERLGDQEYDQLLELERAAGKLGYPDLA